MERLCMNNLIFLILINKANPKFAELMCTVQTSQLASSLLPECFKSLYRVENFHLLALESFLIIRHTLTLLKVDEKMSILASS